MGNEWDERPVGRSRLKESLRYGVGNPRISDSGSGVGAWPVVSAEKSVQPEAAGADFAVNDPATLSEAGRMIRVGLARQAERGDKSWPVLKSSQDLAGE